MSGRGNDPTRGRRAPVAIWPEDVPHPPVPHSPAVMAGGWLFVSGHLASDYTAAGLAPAARVRNPNLDHALDLEARHILGNLQRTVRAAGLDMDRDAVRIWQWVSSDHPTREAFAAGDTWPRIDSVTPYLDVRDLYLSEPRPASTTVGVRHHMVAGAWLALDLICIDGGESIGFAAPQGVPKPLAGYSTALRRGDWVFLSGEPPSDWRGDFGGTVAYGVPGGVAPEARANPYFWYGSEIEAQTDYTLSKLARIAEAAGSSLSRAVKATVYIGDPSLYRGMDRVWRKWFPDNPPARCVIPWMGIGGGRGGLIEIELTLLANDSPLEVIPIQSPRAPAPLGHAPQAVKAGEFLFFSGLMATDEYGLLPQGLNRDPHYPFYGQPARAQMQFMIAAIEGLCEAAATCLGNVVKCSAFHDDGQWVAESADEWASHFPDVMPASTTIVLSGPLVVEGSHTLLDIIAYVPA